MTTDFNAQRLNMVESQVRPSDVTDRRIIRAMLDVPRERFVPQALQSIAYMDVDVPVKPGAPQGQGQARFLLAPRLFAKMVQEARLEAGMTVLDIGCTTGYSTAVLARIARRVTGLEADPDLAALSQKTLSQLDVGNAAIVQGPLAAGLANSAPFDVILVNGAVAQVPQALLEQLGVGGRLIAVVSEGQSGQVCVFKRVGPAFDRRTVFDAGAPPLAEFSGKLEFVF